MAPLGERFNDALAYAATLHREQVRKDTTIPYVSHLLATASIVLEHGGDEDEAIGALLHDAAEDCGGVEELERIRARFGETVATIVEGCSDTLETPKPPWKERKGKYIAHIPDASSSTRLVSAADKLHNCRAILADYRRVGDALWDRFNPESDQLWYYRELVGAFRKAGDHEELVAELEIVVGELGLAVATASTTHAYSSPNNSTNSA
jgi:(p)ppGpp synthase/HD superfamily hydrolase